ncbi:MAG: DEAD/DEAH box helicase, partial [Thermoplasmata archaeon]|nr:DEAD/DEAH box helicase [Thermoplasmata archaeon]
MVESSVLTEAVVEEVALAWFESLGYRIAHGPDIAPGESTSERNDYGEVILERRLRMALARLNPKIPPDALDEAFRRITRTESPSLIINNHNFHKFLTDGVPVEYTGEDGRIAYGSVNVVDFMNLENNDW